MKSWENYATSFDAGLSLCQPIINAEVPYGKCHDELR